MSRVSLFDSFLSMQTTAHRRHMAADITMTMGMAAVRLVLLPLAMAVVRHLVVGGVAAETKVLRESRCWCETCLPILPLKIFKWPLGG